LESEHRAGALRIRELEQALSRYQQGGDGEFAHFASLAEAYVEFERQHMRSEEMEVFPLAQKHLHPEDWIDIDAAFASNADPLHGVSSGKGFDDLFRKIVHLAPPPMGVGPASLAQGE
ncbi:MAG: hemerythrin domain-containing protein, partial [Betaproteobacteria bacterium]